MSRVICITFAWGSYRTWDLLYKNCTQSFKKWHPDIEMRIFGDEDYDGDLSNLNDGHNASIWRYQTVIKMFNEGYTKVILVGLDTFTCSRWDELLEDNVSPVVATLSGPFLFDSQNVNHRHVFLPKHGWFENMFVGSDLVCYNSKKAVEDLLDIQQKFKKHDNHSLNVYVNEVNHNCRVVDFPYMFSQCVYQGLTGWPGLLAPTDCINQNGELRWGFDGPVIGKFSPTTRFLPIDGKLYNHIGKHIKAFSFDKKITKDRMEQYLNKETVHWLKEYCDIDMYY